MRIANWIVVALLCSSEEAGRHQAELQSPTDVKQYATTHDDFPHRPTLDQFFDESQFESYCQLGETVAGKVLRSLFELDTTGEGTIETLVNQLKHRWNEVYPSPKK